MATSVVWGELGGSDKSCTRTSNLVRFQSRCVGVSHVSCHASSGQCGRVMAMLEGGDGTTETTGDTHKARGSGTSLVTAFNLTIYNV